jgi:hypothetical protein
MKKKRNAAIATSLVVGTALLLKSVLSPSERQWWLVWDVPTNNVAPNYPSNLVTTIYHSYEASTDETNWVPWKTVPFTTTQVQFWPTNAMEFFIVRISNVVTHSNSDWGYK